MAATYIFSDNARSEQGQGDEEEIGSAQEKEKKPIDARAKSHSIRPHVVVSVMAVEALHRSSNTQAEKGVLETVQAPGCLASGCTPWSCVP